MNINPTKLDPFAYQYMQNIVESKRVQAAARLDDFVRTALGQSGAATTKGTTSRTGAAASQDSTSRRANFTALYKKQNIKFFQGTDARRQGRQKEMEEVRKGLRSSAIAKSRIPAIIEMTNELNMMIQDDSCQEISDLECTASPPVSVKNMSVSDTSSRDVSKISVESGGGSLTAEKSSSNIASNAKTNKPVQNTKNVPRQDQNRNPAPANLKMDYRRDQLQKWKKEKEAAGTKQNIKQPFKVGAPPTTKPVKSTPATTLVKGVNCGTANSSTLSSGSKSSASVSGPASASARQAPGTSGVGSRTISKGTQPLVASKVAPKQTLGVSSSKPERPVTRAMSKAQTQATVVKNTAGVLIKPPVAKMNALNISEKSIVPKPSFIFKGTTAVPNKSSNVATSSGKNGVVKASSHLSSTTSKKVPSVKTQVKGNDTREPQVAKEDSLNNSKDNSPSDSKNSHLQHTDEKKPQEQETRKKKVKPKPIDDTYTVYNGLFSDACRKLGTISKEWRTILDEQNNLMPEDIRDDVYSALGKVKLLLESKLPQFGELLFQYLLNDPDAVIVLPCDLQGWWDVAYIQVEAVYSIFESLNTIKSNSWKKPEISAPSTKLTNTLSSSKAKLVDSHQLQKGGNFSPKSCKPKTVVRAQASGGLKAFLANKRKMITNNTDCATSRDTTVVNEDPAEEPMDISVANFSKPSIVEPVVVAHPENNLQPVTEIQSRLSLNLKLNLNDSHRTNDEESTTNRLFEGGFFIISSPVTTRNNTPVREGTRKMSSVFNKVAGVSTPGSTVPASYRTPNRPRRLSTVASEDSLRRASLSMLGVRRSMGSFSKIGRVSVFAEGNKEEDVDNWKD